MHFLTAASLLAATATGAALLPRDNVFEVTEFYASCIQHSSMCNYQFSVLRPNQGETTPVKCSVNVGGTDGTLPPVTDGACEQSSRTFDVTKGADGGLVFSVKQPITPSSNITGVYNIRAADVVLEADGASQAERYVGAKEFGLSYA